MRTIGYFANSEPATVEDILDGKEARAQMQRDLLEKYAVPLISFTMNIPGNRKTYPLAIQAFEEGKQAIEEALRQKGATAVHIRSAILKAGCIGLYSVDCPGNALKQWMLEIEGRHPLGRFFDIDVIDVNYKIIHGEERGREQRRCFLCGGPVWECMRARRHPAEELAAYTAKRLHMYFANQYADLTGRLAVRALLYEVCITPKPGLVDRHNCGAHTDMDLFTFIDSSCALIPYFRGITLQAQISAAEPEVLLTVLRPLGLHAEGLMLAATNGINTHKGLIFSMGIVCAALGYLKRLNQTVDLELLCETCARVAGRSLDELELERETASAKTNGQRAHAQHRVTGIRGEAAHGFPSVRRFSYPVLKRLCGQGYSLNESGVIALLHLLAHVDDTNMIHRSDLPTAKRVQKKLARLLAREQRVSPLLLQASKLDEEFIARNLSPGGCADLLAITLLFYFIFD